MRNLTLWLRRPDRKKVILSTDDNIQLILEIIRQTMILPLTYVKTIREALDIIRMLITVCSLPLKCF